jgi:hypothetical protein
MVAIEMSEVSFSATSNYTNDREPADLRDEAGVALRNGLSSAAIEKAASI